MKRKSWGKRSAFAISAGNFIRFEVFNHIAKALNCFIRLSECHPYLINWSIIRNSYLLTNLHKSNSITLPIFFSTPFFRVRCQRQSSEISFYWFVDIRSKVIWEIFFRWYRLIWFLSHQKALKVFDFLLSHDKGTNFSDIQVALWSAFCFIIAMWNVLVAQHESHFSSTWQFFICLVVFFYLFSCFL